VLPLRPPNVRSTPLRKLRETLIPTRTITRGKTWLRTCGRLKTAAAGDAGGDARESSAEKSETVEECAVVGFADQRDGVSGTAAHGGHCGNPGSTAALKSFAPAQERLPFLRQGKPEGGLCTNLFGKRCVQ